MNKKQVNQIQLSPEKKTPEKGKWIHHLLSPNSKEVGESCDKTIESNPFINSTGIFFIRLKMFIM